MGAVQLNTEVPGPKSKALLERRNRAVVPGIVTMAPVFAQRAQGALVTDVDGNTFIDFAGGIGVLAVGHTNVRVQAAVQQQVRSFTHTAFQVMGYESYVQVCERICALSPIRSNSKALLVSTGAEAVENAVKIARIATGRQAVVAFTHGFHGRTLLGMSLTGKVSPYKVGGAYAPEIYRLPYPNCYRCVEVGRGPCCMSTNERIIELLKNIVAPSSIAAFIIEPVLGEGGFIPAPREFMVTLRRLCDEHGIVLIADEIQTGFGRTGSMFACQDLGVEPDLMTFAKSLAGGLPLAGVVGRSSVVDKAPPGSLGGTYAGNPISCAAALATLDVLESEGLLARARVLGKAMRAHLDPLATKSPYVGEVRGIGAMLAMELVKDKQSKTPHADLAKRVQEKALKRGLIVLTAGTNSNVVRLLVPLVISDEELEEGLTILDACVLEG